jgi:hypothetical protein
MLAPAITSKSYNMNRFRRDPQQRVAHGVATVVMRARIAYRMPACRIQMTQQRLAILDQMGQYLSPCV